MTSDAPADPVETALAQLDLAGRVRLLTGASFFSFTGDERIGLAPIAMSDGPSGWRASRRAGAPRPRCCPTRRPWPAPGTSRSPPRTPAGCAYEKAGFVVEGRLREHAWVRGGHEDIVLMGILRSDR